MPDLESIRCIRCLESIRCGILNYYFAIYQVIKAAPSKVAAIVLTQNISLDNPLSDMAADHFKGHLVSGINITNCDTLKDHTNPVLYHSTLFPPPHCDCEQG